MQTAVMILRIVSKQRGRPAGDDSLARLQAAATSPWWARAFFLLCSLVVAGLAAADEGLEARPPVVNTRVDAVVLRGTEFLRGRQLAGQIVDVVGDTVLFRPGRGGREVFHLRDVESLRFGRSEAWERGLVLLETRQWNEAAGQLRDALGQEERAWGVREIRGALCRSLNALGKYDECLAVIERILESDPDSRHVLQLPLVWDPQVPEGDRMSIADADLNSESALRRLVAATSLLQREEHFDACREELRSLYRNSRGTLRLVAELQLWRCHGLGEATATVSQVDRWQERSRELTRELRSVASTVIAQANLRLNRQDLALEGFLWCSFVSPPDPRTAAAAQQRAKNLMEQTGRVELSTLISEQSSDEVSNTPVDSHDMKSPSQ